MPPVRNSRQSDVFKRDVGVRRTMRRMMDFDLLQSVGTDQRRLATWKDLPRVSWKSGCSDYSCLCQLQRASSWTKNTDNHCVSTSKW